MAGVVGKMAEVKPRWSNQTKVNGSSQALGLVPTVATLAPPHCSSHCFLPHCCAHSQLTGILQMPAGFHTSLISPHCSSSCPTGGRLVYAPWEKALSTLVPARCRCRPAASGWAEQLCFRTAAGKHLVGAVGSLNSNATQPWVPNDRGTDKQLPNPSGLPRMRRARSTNAPSTPFNGGRSSMRLMPTPVRRKLGEARKARRPRMRRGMRSGGLESAGHRHRAPISRTATATTSSSCKGGREEGREGGRRGEHSNGQPLIHSK